MREIHVLMLSLVTLLGQQSPQSADAAKLPPGNVVRPGQSGVTAPRLIKEPKPNYTGAAVRARIQGLVTLECVVETDGSVGPVRVIRSLDAQYGLDEEAIRVVKQWRFIPGMKEGTPVRVAVTIEMSFTLRDRDGSTPAPPFDAGALARVGWPAPFISVDDVSTRPAEWIDGTISTSTLDVRYAYPPEWSVLKSNEADRLVTLYAEDAAGTRALTISQPQPSQFSFTEPVSQATLDGFSLSARMGAAFLSDVRHISSGQVRRPGGLWMWFEMAAPSFAAWNARRISGSPAHRKLRRHSRLDVYDDGRGAERQRLLQPRASR